jgi:hypothetical protein
MVELYYLKAGQPFVVGRYYNPTLRELKLRTRELSELLKVPVYFRIKEALNENNNKF